MTVERAESILEEVRRLENMVRRTLAGVRAGDAGAEAHLEDAKKSWQTIGDLAGWDSDD